MTSRVSSRPAGAAPADAAPALFSGRGDGRMWISGALPWQGLDWPVHVAFDRDGRAVDVAGGSGEDTPANGEMIACLDLLSACLLFGGTAAELVALWPPGRSGDELPGALAALIAATEAACGAAAREAYACAANRVRGVR